MHKLIYLRELVFNRIDGLFDKILKVKTNGYLLEINNRELYLGYGPTYYLLLYKLFKKYHFSKQDHIVDFGCGMGRVLLVAAKCRCENITGIEINSDMYGILTNNINQIKIKQQNINIDLRLGKAENTHIDETMNKFYFYNPFHLKVYIKIINIILNSLKDNERKVYLFLFYPKEPYIKYMNGIDGFVLIDIIYGSFGTEYFRVYLNKKGE